VLLAATLLVSLTVHGFGPVATGPAGGAVLQGAFPGTARPGYIYLPPGFTRTKRYPVVYLLHGMPGSPSEFLDGTEIAQFADNAIAAGAVRPFVAVMPAAGTRRRYNGEWAGSWEGALVDNVVPWVDANLPTVAAPRGRVIAGLSAGGYGAVDIALRHPDLFGAAESWSGYFHPLRDGPFRHATAAVLAAHDPTLLARKERSVLAAEGMRFFVSSGPSHSHWFKESATVRYAAELRTLGLAVTLRLYPTLRGEWRDQLDAGLTWAFSR
jgi:S-formylglutathione hydrolase FrmB